MIVFSKYSKLRLGGDDERPEFSDISYFTMLFAGKSISYPSIQTYTPKKMFLLAFSFANFETTRGSRGKANFSFLYCPKKLLLNFQNSQMKKRGETLFMYLGSVCSVLFFYVLASIIKSYSCNTCNMV